MLKSFIDSWQSKYNAGKYSRDLYFNSISKITETNSIDEAANAIIAMLHWKDGRVSINQDGEYVFSQTKPNTYNPDKHNQILKSREFYNWVKSVNGSNYFDICNLDKIKEFGLWGDNSLVIPTFLLHIINPFVYPLYDQHVERARRVLMAEGIDDRPLTTATYIKYKDFFYSIPAESDIKSIKNLDEALWSFGKWLKSLRKEEIPNNISENTDITNYTPDDDFKIRVMMLIRAGEKQGQAIRKVAEEIGVKLSDSYYVYPSSHIDRWKKQGF